MSKSTESSIKRADSSISSPQPAPIKIHVAGKIFIKDAPPKLKSQIRESLSLDNPSYYQALKRNPSAKFYLSKQIKYYEQSRDKTILVTGRGTLERLLRYTAKNNIPICLDDKRASRGASLKSTIRLRAYQVGLPENILSKECGIVRLDPGFGKSIIALRVAELLQQKTLIIVPKKDLVEQFKAEFEKYFTVGKLGVIQGDKFSIGDITIATLQSLRNKIKDGVMNRDEFGCVIADECHLTVPKKSRDVIQFFSPKYLYGFTGTDRRTDEQGPAIQFIYGDKIVDKCLPRAKPNVCVVVNNTHIVMDEYYRIAADLAIDERRNELICRIIQEQINKGRKTLVLTKRIQHYEIIKEILLQQDGILCLSSKEKETKRRETMLGLRDGSIDFTVLLGTFSLLSTGVDIPTLDTLVIAGDLRSDVLAEQSAGRILRLLKGKEAKIIDIWDHGNKILKNQGKERIEFYKSQGWPLTIN